MNAYAEPKQARARATLERIFEASIRLLRERPFEALSVADITSEASTSVGAFYKRFSSKQALLPVLLDWLHREQDAAVHAFVNDPDWQGVGLEARIDAFVAGLVESYSNNRNLMRALVARQYSPANSQSEAQAESASRALQHYSDWLLECRQEMTHPHPEIAVPIGLSALVTQAQARLLFDVRAIELDQARFLRELKRALMAYL